MNTLKIASQFTIGIILCFLTLGIAPGLASASSVVHSPILPDPRGRLPWELPVQDSQDESPFFVGYTPYQMAQSDHLPPLKSVEFASESKDLAVRGYKALSQAILNSGAVQAIATKVGAVRVEFLIWPRYNDVGQPTWSFVKWRLRAKLTSSLTDRQRLAFEWQWLHDDIKELNPDKLDVILPEILEPFSTERIHTRRDVANPLVLPKRHSSKHKASDASTLFGDFMDYDDLYQQPMFGSCVWEDFETGIGLGNWLDPRVYVADDIHNTFVQKSLPERMKKVGVASTKSIVCYSVNQPPYADRTTQVAVIFDGTWNIDEHSPFQVKWHDKLPTTLPVLHGQSGIKVTQWSQSYRHDFENEVRRLTNEPFTPSKRGSFQKDNVLLNMVDDLEGYYKKINIRTFRQEFTWRGVPQANLVAVLPANHKPNTREAISSDPKDLESDRTTSKVVLADHIDAACAEDRFANHNIRETTAGASDNITATVTLMQAAVALRDLPRSHDIWLVHLTGEEYPSEDLGARMFLSRILQRKVRISAEVISDFIGFHREHERKYQVSPSHNPGAEVLAAIAMQANELQLKKSGNLIGNLTPLFRPRSSRANGVFNTDVSWFEHFGIPGILFNEYLNYDDRDKYDWHNHQSSDTADNVDFDYASDISKVIIETVAHIADLN